MTRLEILLKPHVAVMASPSTALRINSAKQSLLKRKIASSLEPALSPVEGAPRNDVFLSHAMRLWRISAAVLTSIVIMPTLALAHGGMGPDEIGPPIMTSGLIGFVSYWAVMLWPSTKKKDDQGLGASGQNLSTSQTGRRPKKRSARVKRMPRLRKIEGNGQFDSNQNTRRKASDG